MLFWICFDLSFLFVWESAIYSCCSCFRVILLEVHIFSCCLTNRDIWWGIFAALLVPPAEYSNFVCILSRYLLVSRFSLAYCMAICSFALVEILVENTYSEFFILVIFVFLFNLRLLISNNVLFVSAIPVGASDRLAELLNRSWWQEWGWTRDLTATSSMVLFWVLIGNRLLMSGICSVTASITTVSRI